MTIFLRFRLPVFILMIALCGANVGCDLGTYAQRAESSSQGYTTPKVVMPAASSEDGEKMGEKTDGPNVAGSWSMDATTTANMIQRKVNPVLAGGPAAHKQFVETIREGQMNFELKADGTFTCHEEMDSQTADYRGNWSINGDKIEINQTHNGSKPEKDRLVGTVNGNKMDLENVAKTVKLPIVLRRQ